MIVRACEARFWTARCRVILDRVRWSAGRDLDAVYFARRRYLERVLGRLESHSLIPDEGEVPRLNRGILKASGMT